MIKYMPIYFFYFFHLASVTGATNGKSGSFKSAFSGSGQPSKNGFRVSFRNPSDGQAHTLFAPDEHSKKQWLAALKKLAPQEDSTTNDEPIIKPCLTTETGMFNNSFSPLRL